MKDYLTVVEFAAAGITKQAVYKRIKQDLAPYVKSKTEKRLYQNSGHEKDVTIEWIVLDVILKDGELEDNWNTWVEEKMAVVQPVLDQLNK